MLAKSIRFSASAAALVVAGGALLFAEPQHKHAVHPCGTRRSLEQILRISCTGLDGQISAKNAHKSLYLCGGLAIKKRWEITTRTAAMTTRLTSISPSLIPAGKFKRGERRLSQLSQSRHANSGIQRQE
jgi:hypothetical protein